VLISEEALWNNRFILADKKPIMYRNWLNHGIKTIHDLYSDIKSLLSPNQLSQKFNLPIKQMPYNSLIQAIPSKWKQYMLEGQHFDKTSSSNETLITVNDKRICMNALKSHMLYWHFVNRLSKSPTAIDKWISEFVFLNDNDFTNFFELPYKVLRDTKMQTFQYSILHRIFPCGAALHTWRLTEDSNCTYCSAHDCLSHFFFDCPVAKEFWIQVSKWIFNTMDITIPIKKIDVLFGIPSYDQFMLCLNLVILYGKWHIYTCKKNGKRPFLLNFLLELKSVLNIERYIMITQDSIEKFTEKWRILYEVLF
jgi:hypothetical protein